MSCYGNNMQFFEFQKQLSPYQVFSLRDAQKVITGFSYRQLDRWAKKGYLKKIKREYYVLANREIDQNLLFLTANKIYSPSYISLEKALKFYGIIPEEIFQITCVSTRKTARFNTTVGNFNYRHIKPELFFGYYMLQFGAQKILMAELEKAILDYLYLNPHIKTRDDFREMRLNSEELSKKIDFEKINKYLTAYTNKSLLRRTKIFLTVFK